MPVGMVVGGMVGSAAISTHANKQAGKVATGAARDANATQLAVTNAQFQASEPWRQMGGQALNLMGSYYGFTPQTINPVQIGGTSPTGAATGPAPTMPSNIRPGSIQALIWQSQNQPQPGAPQANPLATATPPTANPLAGNPMALLEMDPGYRVRMEEGARGVNTSWAANGMRESGAAMKAMERYRQEQGSQEFGNAWNRLSAMAGVGQSVNQSNNALAQNYGNQYGQNVTNAANTRASSYAVNGQTWGNALGGIAGFGMQQGWGQGGGGMTPAASPYDPLARAGAY